MIRKAYLAVNWFIIRFLIAVPLTLLVMALAFVVAVLLFGKPAVGAEIDPTGCDCKGWAVIFFAIGFTSTLLGAVLIFLIIAARDALKRKRRWP